MPGLLRGIARTAVVAGTATAVSGRVARRQRARFADRDAEIYAERDRAYDQQMYGQQAAPPPAAVPPDDMISRLEQLGNLRDDGILTDEEFADQKARILG